jgi:EAL domain-containing protein (putative c-di-GMP-specific phosphodiesterase class I)
LSASSQSGHRRRSPSISTKHSATGGWHQSKIDPQSLVPRGAEALIRVRHPTWGVVVLAYFIPAADDPYLHALSRFVIARALADSTQFAGANHPVVHPFPCR